MSTPSSTAKPGCGGEFFIDVGKETKKCMLLKNGLAH